jgi:ATP-dependent DNA helicase 2 subunit 2
VEKHKSRNKRLSEKFWRAFVNGLGERVAQTSDFELFKPTLKTFDDELMDARKPHPAVVNGTVTGMNLYIGAEGMDPEQAIKIPIKYSKATMKARAPTLSKAWKAAVDLQAPAGSSQLHSTLEDMQSQAHSQHKPVPQASDLAALVSSDVKRHSMYVVKHKPDPPATQSSQAQSQTQQSQSQVLASQAATQTQLNDIPEAEEEEELVDKEDIVKAYRFGSSWIPIEHV